MNGWRVEFIFEIVKNGSVVETFEVMASDREAAIEVAWQVAHKRWKSDIEMARVEIVSSPNVLPAPFGIRAKLRPKDSTL